MKLDKLILQRMWKNKSNRNILKILKNTKKLSQSNIESFCKTIEILLQARPVD